MFQIPFNEETEQMLDDKLKLAPKMIFFSGKGGVGKTSTCASVAIARAKEGKRVLIASIDPAHSLGDSLGISLSDNEMHDVPGIANAKAIEVLVFENARRNKQEKEDMHDLAEEEAISAILGEVFFPMSEEMNTIKGFIKLLNKIHTSKEQFDEIFIDGSPSGHMLRALSFPFALDDFFTKVVRSLGKFNMILGYKRGKGLVIKKQVEMMNALQRIMRSLTNKALSSICLVTIPEMLSYMETCRTKQSLDDIGIGVSNIIINKVNSDLGHLDRSKCGFCRKRMEQEDSIIKKLEREFSDSAAVTKVPLLENEVVGLDALQTMAQYLIN